MNRTIFAMTSMGIDSLLSPWWHDLVAYVKFMEPHDRCELKRWIIYNMDVTFMSADVIFKCETLIFTHSSRKILLQVKRVYLQKHSNVKVSQNIYKYMLCRCNVWSYIRANPFITMEPTWVKSSWLLFLLLQWSIRYF